jgi:hypothetical protein
MYTISLRTQIAGIECDLEVEDGVSHCYLNRGRYSGSLEFLKAYGYLEDFNGNGLQVSAEVQKKIEDWALRNGY